MSSPSRRLRRIAAALMMCTSLTLATLALSKRAEASSPGFAGFMESGYTYCDAKLYAAFWKMGISEGKAQMGDKIARGDGAAVPEHIALGRAITTCDFADTQLSYEDAEAIAKAWDLPNVAAAKDKIAELYTAGMSAEVTTALGGASGANEGSGDEAAVNAFYGSAFTYCDAKLVGAAWGTDVWQGKVTIGNKVSNGMAADVEPILVQGRQVASCDFSETDLSYDDAVKLASIWRVKVGKAKDKAAAYFTAGQSSIVKRALGATSKPSVPGKVGNEGKPKNQSE